MEKRFFTPELHGRDHISVPFWMKLLREGNRDLLTAFAHGYVFLEISSVPQPARGFRAEYYFSEEVHKVSHVEAIKESVSLFKDIFNFQPRIFVPGNGFFHPDFEKELAVNGISFLNVNFLSPYCSGESKLKYRRLIPGQNGPNGLIYYIRNCVFEPNDPKFINTDATLNQVAAAFRWGKIANISTHRVNFAGAIHPLNRERGLNELKILLQRIIEKWPDVEFMSSTEAFELMSN